MESAIGMIIFALGGLCGASFALPFRKVKGWAYESYWLVYSIVGLIVFPLLLAVITVPDVFGVIGKVPASTTLGCVGYGALWGVGGLTWGLMIRYLGIGLGLAIGCGLCSATGTLIPPILQGRASDLVKDTSALITLGGVLASLLGIVFVGFAGVLKERELPEEEKKKAVAEFNFKKGILVALVSGIFSAGMNFGLQNGWWKDAAGNMHTIADLARDAGAGAWWVGMPVLVVVLWGGFLVQLAYCLSSNLKNGTFSDYAKSFSPAGLGVLVLSSLAGIIWSCQFALMKIGEPLCGKIAYIGFAVVMAASIFFSTGFGIFLGEWKGTGGKTKACLATGTFVLVLSFCLMALGSR